jgi:hypothetical protein
LVIVTGASAQDDWKPVINPQIAPILGQVQAEYLVGRPLPVLQKRLRELGSAHRPHCGGVLRTVYAATDVAQGRGVVGRRMLSYEGTGTTIDEDVTCFALCAPCLQQHYPFLARKRGCLRTRPTRSIREVDTRPDWC